MNRYGKITVCKCSIKLGKFDCTLKSGIKNVNKKLTAYFENYFSPKFKFGHE